MGKVQVKLYKTIRGAVRLQAVRYFDTVAQAIECADEWEARTLDNFAVYR